MGPDHQWHVYEKKSNGEVINQGTVDSDSLFFVGENKEKEIVVPPRAPAAVPPPEENKTRVYHSSRKENRQKVFGRRVIGVMPEYFAFENLTAVNSYNPEWRNKLANELLRFQDPHIKVYINKVESVVKIHDYQARRMEHVNITFLIDEDRRHFQSYSALIDSETGRVIQTWNQTIHEPLRSQRRPVELIPTGSL